METRNAWAYIGIMGAVIIMTVVAAPRAQAANNDRAPAVSIPTTISSASEPSSDSSATTGGVATTGHKCISPTSADTECTTTTDLCVSEDGKKWAKAPCPTGYKPTTPANATAACTPAQAFAQATANILTCCKGCTPNGFSTSYDQNTPPGCCKATVTLNCIPDKSTAESSPASGH